MNLRATYEVYRVRMETVFTAPFTGMGYFITSSDDSVQMRIVKMSESGQNVSNEEVILNAPYTRCVSAWCERVQARQSARGSN